MAAKSLAALAFAACVTVSASGGDLFPFAMPWNDTGNGGVTDLSTWNEGPAGAKGFVSVANGHLMAGGKRLKLLGINLVFGSNFPTHEEADIAARRMARFGINIARFHHMDTAPTPNGLLQKDRRSFDPVQLDRMDYFIAAMKRAGIYTDLNLHVGREYPGMGAIWEGGPAYWKGVDHFYPAMIAEQKDFARNLLTHTNPYTGTRYADEPAVALVEINNENGLIREWVDGTLDGMTEPFRRALALRWNGWLQKRYGSEADLQNAWGTAEERLGGEMLTSKLGPSTGQKSWTLQTLGGAKAALSSTPEGYRIALQGKGQESWHTQFFHGGISLTADRPYTLTMTLRADHPMTAMVSAMANHAPWTQLWWRRIKIGTDWTTIDLTFSPGTSDSDARLMLGELGFETGQIEIRAISLKPGGVAGFAPGESLSRGTIAVIDYANRSSRTVAAQRDWLNFLWETEEGYWSEMQRFLKNELKVRSLLIGSQVSYSPAAIQAKFDVVDGHEYWEHPIFPGRSWDIGNWHIKNTPMAGIDGSGTIADLALRRVPGKPFVVTEYNTPAPSLYQGESMPLIAAYGALQDWDGIFLFCYGDWSADWKVDHIGDFFDGRGNPVKMVSFISAAAMLRRGDIAAAAPALAPLPPRSDWIEALRRRPRLPGADSFGAPRNLALQRWVSAATTAAAAPSLPVKSDTGELIWGLGAPSGKIVVIDSARSKGLIGAKLGQPYDAHGVGLELTDARNNWGAVLANVIDGQDFSSPGRILVTTLGQEENTGQQWNAEKTSVGRNFGHAPVLVEGLGARLSLPIAARRVSAWALDAQGARTRPLPVQGSDKALIELSETYRTLWYEIEIH